MTTATLTAIDLYQTDSDLQALIACWIEHRRCPLVLVDWFLERDLERQAEAARWCATESDLIESYSRPHKRCGPFPCEWNGRWYWYSAGDGDRDEPNRSYYLPVECVGVINYVTNRFSCKTAAILWLLDHWK